MAIKTEVERRYDFDKLPSLDPRPLSEMTKFDALGLPE